MTRPIPSPALPRCAGLAAAQHGIVTREQALWAGVTSSQVRHELARGAWIEVRTGVYRCQGAPATWQQRAMAACIGRVHATAVSHRSAAFLHGLLTTPPEPLEVIAPRGTSVEGLAHIAAVHSVRVPPGALEIGAVGPIPVTTLPRTLADLAGGVPASELCELVDRAMRSLRHDWERASTLRTLEELVPGRRGAGALRSALEPWTVDRRGARKMESVLEARVLRILLEAGLPIPECQYPVVLPGGGRYYLDFAWPARRVGLEVDGYAFHSNRRSFDNDRMRGNRLLALGWQILHTTDGETRQPESLVNTLFYML